MCEQPDGIYIVASDVNQTDLRSVLPQFHQHVHALLYRSVLICILSDLGSFLLCLLNLQESLIILYVFTAKGRVGLHKESHYTPVKLSVFQHV